jgi:hypothetical protein
VWILSDQNFLRIKNIKLWTELLDIIMGKRLWLGLTGLLFAGSAFAQDSVAAKSATETSSISSLVQFGCCLQQ